jgi:hypothetical protein
MESRRANTTSINVAKISLEFRDKFVEFCNKNHMTQSQAFKRYEDFMFLYTEKEQKIIDEACEISGLTQSEIYKQSALKCAKSILNKKKNAVPIEEVNKNSKTSGRAADLRVKEFVDEIMLSNDSISDDEWYKRKYLSKSYILDESLEKHRTDSSFSSFSAAVVQRYLTAHRKEIEEHHKKHNMNQDHNNRAFQAKRKLAGSN